MPLLEDPSDATADAADTTPAEGADPGTDAAPPAEDWDGEVTTIDKQSWWATLPEKAQQHLKGVYTARDEARQQASYLDKLFSSDDAVAEVRKELAGLKESLGAKDGELTKLREEHQKAQEELEDARLDRAISFYQQTYPDIMNDVHFKDEAKTELDNEKGAFPVFAELVRGGMPHEKAAKLARAVLTQPASAAAPAAQAPQPRAVDVPPAVRAMSKGGPPAGATAGLGGSKSLADALQDMAER